MFLEISSNQHIRMICEASCDPEVMMLKIQRCISEINYIFKINQNKI